MHSVARINTASVTKYLNKHDTWVQVFKNGPSEICGRQPLKIVTWSILEYFVPHVLCTQC